MNKQYKIVSALFALISILALGITLGGLITMSEFEFPSNTSLPQPIVASLFSFGVFSFLAIFVFEVFVKQKNRDTEE